MTFSEFRTYVLELLWSTNNSVLSADFGNLLMTAEQELDQLTYDWDRRQDTLTIAPTSEDFDLSTITNFKAVRSVTDNVAESYSSSQGLKGLAKTTPDHMYQLRAKYPDRKQAYYAVDTDNGTPYLRLAGPFSVTDPGDYTVVVFLAVPSLEAGPSWIESDFFNLLLYTVLKHCAVYLREDERIEMYTKQQADALQMADRVQKHQAALSGAPIHMRPHRAVP